MLANLAQLSPWVWIAAIAVIVVVTGVIIWARRRKFHVTEVEISTPVGKVKLEPDKPASAAASVESPSVNISGMKLFGKSKISVRRDKTNISDSTLVGEHEIDVAPKPQTQKGKPHK